MKVDVTIQCNGLDRTGRCNKQDSMMWQKCYECCLFCGPDSLDCSEVCDIVDEINLSGKVEAHPETLRANKEK